MATFKDKKVAHLGRIENKVTVSFELKMGKFWTKMGKSEPTMGFPETKIFNRS